MKKAYLERVVRETICFLLDLGFRFDARDPKYQKLRVLAMMAGLTLKDFKRADISARREYTEFRRIRQMIIAREFPETFLN